MNQFSRISTRLAGVMLIVGPALIVSAAFIAASGIGTTTGRWYDNKLEGLLMAAGFSLQLVGLLEIARRIGVRFPGLGILSLLLSVLGTSGAVMPSTMRIFSAIQLEYGFTVDQLDLIHNSTGAETDPMAIVLPFILCFFLNYLFMAFGIWRAKFGPRAAPLLLVVGTVLFIAGQSSFVVNMPAYVAGVSAWLLGLASVGVGFIREGVSSERVLFEPGSAD